MAPASNAPAAPPAAPIFSIAAACPGGRRRRNASTQASNAPALAALAINASIQASNAPALGAAAIVAADCGNNGSSGRLAGYHASVTIVPARVSPRFCLLSITAFPSVNLVTISRTTACALKRSA